MLNMLIEPFRFDFINYALIIALLVSVPCALLSVFLVLKGWALMGDAMSHAVFPGVVLAWIVGLPLGTGAFVAGLSCALLTGYIKDNSRIKQDTLLGIIFSGMFASGLILYVSVRPDAPLEHILQTGTIALFILLITGIKWRDFLLYCFDIQQARVSGLRTGWLYYGLLSMISLTVVATLKSVGIILSVSLLIAPGAIAVLLTQRFSNALFIAVALSALVSTTGVYLSYFIDSAPAPTVVLLFALIFIVIFIYSSFKYNEKYL